ncbi:MAG: hypothetical protein JOZ60_06085 [Verrucomicrobia bacterium]|nr:hypothetical protein [Verrucomicrobiota bacterium]
MRSKWASGKAVRPGDWRWEGTYLNRYVTEEQRSRRPIFIATLRAAHLSAGCFVAHRSKTAAGILPLRFAHPAEIRGGAAIPDTDLVHYTRLFSFFQALCAKLPSFNPSGINASRHLPAAAIS